MSGANKSKYPDIVSQKDEIAATVALAEVDEDLEEDLEEEDEENELEEEEEEDVEIEEEEDEDEGLMKDDTIRLHREQQCHKLEQQRQQHLRKSTQRYQEEVKYAI